MSMPACSWSRAGLSAESAPCLPQIVQPADRLIENRVDRLWLLSTLVIRVIVIGIHLVRLANDLFPAVSQK